MKLSQLYNVHNVHMGSRNVTARALSSKVNQTKHIILQLQKLFCTELSSHS